MKKIVFDTSSIISIVMNDLLWVLGGLKNSFDGIFYIPYSVKKELVDKPLTTKKYKLEAIMVSKVINDHILNVHSSLDTNVLLEHVNNIYLVDRKPLHIVDLAEVEALALYLRLQADAYVVDERTMRLVIEDPDGLRRVLERKLQRRVEINKNVLKDFRHLARGVKIIRSTELATVAFEKDFFNKFVTGDNTDKDIIEGLLWGLRLRGCSISTDEIDEIIKIESKK